MKSIRPPGSRQVATRSSVSGIDATARVITPATCPGNSGPTLPAKTSTSLEPEPLADLAEELGPRPRGSARIIRDARPRDLQRDARQARPRAHVDQRRGQLREPEDQQAVDIVLQHHVLEVVDPRQVQPALAARSIR